MFLHIYLFLALAPSTVSSKNTGKDIVVVVEAKGNPQPFVTGRMARFFQLESIKLTWGIDRELLGKGYTQR